MLVNTVLILSFLLLKEKQIKIGKDMNKDDWRQNIFCTGKKQGLFLAWKII